MGTPMDYCTLSYCSLVPFYFVVIVLYRSVAVGMYGIHYLSYVCPLLLNIPRAVLNGSRYPKYWPKVIDTLNPQESTSNSLESIIIRIQTNRSQKYSPSDHPISGPPFLFVPPCWQSPHPLYASSARLSSIPLSLHSRLLFAISLTPAILLAHRLSIIVRKVYPCWQLITPIA